MYTFEDLLKIMEKLRGEGGCPWDREQTYESLKRYVLEEAYEVIEAVDESRAALADELGDLLLQVVFYAQIGKEAGDFTIDDVLSYVCNKMIHRHPHVFGDAVAETSDDVLVNWAQIKKQEKGQKTQTDAMQGISAVLPALMRAYKVQEAAAKVGFDWDGAAPAVEKLREETGEFERELGVDAARAEEEFGDLLFAAVNVARLSGIQPELALQKGTEKFIRRFSQVEQMALEMGRSLEAMSLSEMDELWERVKISQNENKN